MLVVVVSHAPRASLEPVWMLGTQATVVDYTMGDDLQQDAQAKIMATFDKVLKVFPVPQSGINDIWPSTGIDGGYALKMMRAGI